MPAIQFKRFTKPQVLRGIGRELLRQFFLVFQDELSAGLWLPEPGLPDEEYYAGLARALLAPELLPDRLNEAIYAIDEMATPEGQERLELGMAEAGLDLIPAPEGSRAEFAMQVWLAAPELLIRKHNEQRLRRLTRFEHFRAREPYSRATLFSPLQPGALAALHASLDSWFVRHQRGHETARVDLYSMDEERWFLVRHGDTFTRTPSVRGPRTEILQFRPERDDLVVYSPEHDELRIHARTRGERELYRRQFGVLLRGNADYFSERLTYTLEPLRVDGPEALDPHGVEGIDRITLREVEVISENGNDEYEIIGGRDLFAADASPRTCVPKAGRLSRACFDVLFAGCRRSRSVQIVPPNVLKLGRHCDGRGINRWMSRSRFRIAATADVNG